MQNVKIEENLNESKTEVKPKKQYNKKKIDPDFKVFINFIKVCQREEKKVSAVPTKGRKKHSFKHFKNLLKILILP